MKGRKISPYAAVVGGYKICVFAARLYASFKGNGFAKWGPPNFEVFNTIDWSWTELPELTEYRECGLNAIFLTSYCIVRSCLVICTDIGMYGINIDAVCPKWVKMEGRQRIPPSLKRWEMIGENACGPFEVVRWGEAKANPLAFRNKGSFIPFDGCGVLCSERVDNVTMLCGVYSTIRDDWVPVLLVNVAKFDNELLDSLRGEKWKTIESDESWVFAIESQECEVMDLMSCFQYTETKMGNPAFRVPLHYPRCDEADYETMEEWRLDLLLSEYGFNLNNATIQEKRNFAMGAFLWPTQY